jgi:putative hydrolase of the HAD superfamily
MKKNIKLVAFDLDNTLYNENEYLESVITKFCEHHQFDNKLFIEDFRKIQRNSGDIFGSLLKMQGIFSKELQEELFSLYQSINIILQPYKHATSILNKLKEKSIRTAIITNGDLKSQENKIESLGLNDKVDLIIYARKWGKEFEKPHAMPFEYLLRYFSCLPSEILYVGDNQQTDIEACTRVGIEGIKIESDEQLLSVLNYIN